MSHDSTVEEDDDPHLKFQLKTALIYDALYLFANALRHLGHMVQPKQLFCNATNLENWEHGLSLITYMRTVR